MNKNKKEKRCFKQLTLHDRIRIEIRYKDGWSLRRVASELGNGRTAGSVLREIDVSSKDGPCYY